MQVRQTAVEGLLLVEPRVHGDNRGYFYESFHAERYAAAGLPAAFVQDNVSRSCARTLRGLHLQQPHAQGKLVYALEGEIFDVGVDVRVGSPSYGKWDGRVLSGDNKHQLYVPPGFAHGFVVLSDHAVVSYKCTELYHPESELGIAWNDPDIGIEWPIDDPILSAKDSVAPRLGEVDPARLPRFGDST